MNIKHWQILSILAPIFFVVYSYIPITSPPKFNHPDENVNYFFSNLYSQTGELSYSEDLNKVAYGIILHRNTIYVNEKVTTAKFIGYPVIDGTLAVILPEILRFLTPLLAIIGALFLYLIIKDIFNKNIALLSFILVLILPPFWHTTTLIMLENTAASVMLIISMRYFFKLLNTNEVSSYIIFGLFFGLSLFIRPDFILFSFPLLVLLIWDLKQLKIQNAFLGLFSLLFALCPFFILNNELYGYFLYTGQHVIYESTRVIPISSFSILSIFENSKMLIKISPLIFLFGLLGVFYPKKNSEQLKYTIFSLLCLLAMTLYFLSGPIESDHNTLGSSSYVRYLLPIYLLFIPLISNFIVAFKPKLISILIVFSIVVTNVLITLPIVSQYSNDCQQVAKLNVEIVKHTDPNAIIFVWQSRWDKVIFPERRVGLVSELPEENRGEILSEITVNLLERDIPIYLLIEEPSKQLIDYEVLVKDLSISGYNLTETGTKDLYEIKMVMGK